MAASDSKADQLYCGRHVRLALAFFFGLLSMASSCGQGLYLRTFSFTSNYFLCWFTQGFLIISLPLWLLGEALFGGVRGVIRDRRASSFLKGVSEQLSLAMVPLRAAFGLTAKDIAEGGARRAGIRRIAGLALMAVLNFASTYLWYWALNYVTVTALQAIYSILGQFTYIFSIFTCAERITLPKSLAVFVSFAGTIIMAMAPQAQNSGGADGDDSSGSSVDGGVSSSLWALGCGLIIISAFIYSLFLIVYQKVIGLRDARVVMASMSIDGIFVAFLLWIPMWPILATGTEPTPDIRSGQVIAFLFINVVFNVWYDVAYAFGITTGEPTWMALYTDLIAILIALVEERIYNGTIPGWMQGLGIALLVCGSLLSSIRNIERFAIVDLDLVQWTRSLFCGKQRLDEKEDTIVTPQELATSPVPASSPVSNAESAPPVELESRLRDGSLSS